MCNPIVSTGFFLQKRGVTYRDIAIMPNTLGGLPKGCVQRLSGEGIISKSGRVYRDRAWRVVWAKGHNWSRLEKWMRAHEGK